MTDLTDLPDQTAAEPEQQHVPEPIAPTDHDSSLQRRTILRVGAGVVTGAAVIGARDLWVPSMARRGLLSPDGAFGAASTALGDAVFFTEVFPTSPLILSPFKDPLNVPKALAPTAASVFKAWSDPPGPGPGQQNSLRNETHQLWSSDVGSPDPLVYQIDVQVAPHSFTTSQVLPIDSKGKPAVSFDANGKQMAKGLPRTLPASTIYGFNGTFPGPMINAEYGKPSLVRFSNHLDENPYGLDRQDFGAPDYSFLTHLHNGHTAPESDGNPHYAFLRGPKSTSGFSPKMWVDQLYLNWPAGGQESEKQSFFWFHDHRMDHTGANVYKGLVGLYPLYDPVADNGNENMGYRLPGVRTDNPDGSFDVDYDIPLAFFDCRLDDGVTLHHDFHDAEYPAAGNPRKHPEWWGKTFYRHFPNHGFVGDLFTVNGTAYPVLDVKRRKYRFRFLDCSVSRIYDFKLMTSTLGPKAARDLGYTGDDLDGQYRIPDGQQCMKFTEIATDGGLLPAPIVRDNFELWPAKRREVIVDFTQYMDGSPTTEGDLIYLTDVMKMSSGRMWDNSTRFQPDAAYKVPVMAFRIGKIAEDNSRIPTQMRPLPPLPKDWAKGLDNRLIFEVKRGQLGGEIEWLINGEAFDPTTDLRSLKNPAKKTPLAQQPKGSFALWEIRNGGGGWVHPFHLHMEEHRTVMRNGKDVTTRPDPGHPDDISREDLVALDPSESVIIYRGFRDFVGPYVAHCHNLAHEDHAMMFGWSITDDRDGGGSGAMTPKTDVETRYDARSGAGPASAPDQESHQASSELTGWDRRRASVSWSHVLPLAVVLAFANGFWMITLRGAIGAIERTSAPFSTWWHESTLLVPVYVVAMLAAFVLAQRWFGPGPHGLRPVVVTIAVVTAAATTAGTLLLIASSWFDFRLQRIDLHHMGAVHPGCDPTCAAARVQATLNLELKGVWIGLLLMLVTDLVLVALVVAFRGGEVVLAKPPRPPGPRRREDARLVLAAGLLGAAAINAAVVPEHLDHRLVVGVVFMALALAEVAAAVAVLTRGAWRRTGLVAAIVVSAGSLLVWLVLRTAGLPFGPLAAVGVADVLSCVLELTTLVIAVALLRRHGPARAWSRQGLALALTAVLAGTLIGIGGAQLPVVGAFSHLGAHHPAPVVLPQG